jgi:glycosyltransferase involved in cell wall biosynthesis
VPISTGRSISSADPPRLDQVAIAQPRDGLGTPQERGAILYDCRTLAVAAGTGIANYTTELVSAARGLGYTAHGLVATKQLPKNDDPLLAEVQANDSLTPCHVGDHVYLHLSWVFGRPLGVAARRIITSATNGGDDRKNIAQFDQTFGSPWVFEVAKNHFGRYRRRLAVRLETPPSLFHAMSPIPVRVRGCPNIYTIHDLIPVLFPYMTSDDKRVLLTLLRHLVRHADHIVTVSEHSRRDIIRLLGVEESRITNTYQCRTARPEQLRGRHADKILDECTRRYDLEVGEYFIFVGALEPKKNVARLVEAFARANSRFPLLIVGPNGWLYDEDVRRIGDEKFLQYHLIDGVMRPRRQVRRLPYLERGDLVALIRGARALLFPSLYEGFGLPVLEAMQLGVPVLTSNVASMPEVAGDAALLVDPRDTAAISAAIRQLEADTGLCKALSARGLERAEMFSPERYKQRIGELYSRVM